MPVARPEWNTAGVATWRGGAGATFVGRGRELELLGSAVTRARGGAAGALLISGDAGVGKTTLVQQACDRAGTDVLVLRGAGMPLSAQTIPLLALRSAARGLPASQRPPLLSGSGTREPLTDVPLLFDEWLDDTTQERPVVLAIDDLHWVDQSTLDVLLYVLAGSPHRRLALLMTLRSSEVGARPTLQRWLADARRLPVLEELHLGPLDRDETRSQLADLLGGPPHEPLVGEVFAHTEGNPYLNRLLVAGLPADALHLPDDLPDNLRAAVLQPWHDLSPQARELVRVIAVGGRAAAGRHLDLAAALAAVTTPSPLLREAVEAGVLDLDPHEGYWFHHPLQAEALQATLAPLEAAALHASWAEVVECDLGDDDTDTAVELEAVTVVAEHHYLAGHDAEAYRWSLRAVDLAERAGGASEQLRLLRRSLDLRSRVVSASESDVELLDRLRGCAQALGDHEEELWAVESLLARLREEEQPSRVAELLVRRAHLRFSTGRGFLLVDEMRRAVDLAAREPGSWQHAFALAELAHAGLWADEPAAPEWARQSLEAARGAGHPRALAYALATNAMLAVFENRTEEGMELGCQGVEEAARAGDGWAFVHAALWEANAIDTPVNPRWAQRVQTRREELERLGGAHPYVAWLSATEAGSWLYAGEWKACSERLRVALGSDPGVGPDVITRLVAARLAALQGRQREAEAHLERAEELCADTSTFLAFEFDAVRATVRLHAGDLEGAVEAALTGATVEGVPPTMCEWLCPLAARALADQVQALRDAGRSTTEPLARLEDVVARFPHVIADTGGATEFYTRELEALDALYAAEVARARAEPEAGCRWTHAVELLEGILPWEEAYAAWRAAEAQLAHGVGHRDEGAAMLRRAFALAQGLQALPVLREVEDLARTARISLSAVARPLPPAEPAGARTVQHPLAGLTAREREVLEYIVAGRTYGEIARALVLSEKTVSSHVSNLLRKTGAANRVDLARLATHSSPPPVDGVSG
jgi:DNA-binding CsgD family transcriptional regulator